MTTKPIFEFRDHTTVTLAKVNLRKEHHGDQLVQAVDLNLGLNIQNTDMEAFAPGLCSALYHNRAADTGQQQIEGVPETLPNLRFPRLNGGKFAIGDKKNKLSGYELLIEYGLGDELSNMAFDVCRVCNIKIETLEGGTVHLSWQVQYSGDRLDVATCGKLASMECDEITIQLIPPAVPVPDEPEEPMENPFPVQGEDERPLTAEDLFINGGAHLQDGEDSPGAGSSDDASDAPDQDGSPF